MSLNIVLIEPEIPQNTGNIARTCATTGAILHLVGPLGFSISDKHVKRAGLDYWDDVQLNYYNSFDEVKEKYPMGQFYYATTKGANVYSNVKYPDECFLVFGKETAGLPEDLLKQNLENCIRIPMRETLRSLNLANSVAIIAFEYFRQKDFCGFQHAGKLSK